MFRRSIRLLVAFALGLLASPSDAATSLKVLALTDTPSSIPGEDYFVIYPGYLNADGRVVFSGGTDAGNEFVATIQPHPAQTAARSGAHPPNTPAGTEFVWFDDHCISADGQIAFHALIKGPGVTAANNTGIWAGASNQLQLVARSNDVAPGAGTARFNIATLDLGLSNSGVVTFRSELTDNRVGIWSGPRSGLQAVAISGNAAPGTSGTFHTFSSTKQPVANSGGRIAFQATAEIGGDLLQGIWTGTAGNLSLVTREDLPVPSMGANAELSHIWRPPQINNADEVGFIGQTWDTVEFESSEAIFLKSSAGLQPIVTRGSTAPGFGAGATFDSFFEFHMGGTKRVAFTGLVDVPSDGVAYGLFVYDNGTKRLVAREDQQIPGVSEDIRFDHFHEFFVNEAGRVAFIATTSFPEFAEGLWAENDAGELLEVIRVGQQIEVAPGDFRTVDRLTAGVEFLAPMNSRQPWNASGELVFRVESGTTEALFLFDANGATTLLGDFNHDGTVNAADYTVWRDGLGDEYDQSDYNDWKSHFGQSLGAGSASTTAIPEPATAVLIFVGAALVVLPKMSARHPR